MEGTNNVLHAAIEAGVKRVVCLSTDKAAYPINAMGTSKTMMEHVVRANARVAAERGSTVICCTRYGNVMCSRRSVIPFFIEQIKSGQPITITNPEMTRFLMNLDEAVELVRFAFEHGNPGDLFIQKADASTIGVLAEAVQKLFGDTGTRIIGGKMRILVTGSNGFVGRNLVWNLKELRDGKNGTRPDLTVTEIYGYDVGSPQEDLDRACERCDFVFNLAGVNRPKETEEFMEGNYGFASVLLDTLKAHHNTCPVMLSSSVQASLAGRFQDSVYGKSKLAGEELFFRYGKKTGAKVLVYRFPNLFGKWCRPNYNSVVATFCNAMANDLDYTINDPDTELELVYIDDLIDEMLDALEGKEHRCSYPVDGPHNGLEAVKAPDGRYCYVPVAYHVSLGEIVDLLNTFKQMPATLCMPEIPKDTFAKKLYSTYLTYLPPSKIAYPFRSNVDSRGNFTELIRTLNCGQVSVSVAKPGITRGEHWHNSKWEIFIVVSGHGLIRERRIGIDPETMQEYPVIEFEVTGEQMKAVQILPGYTHSIVNLSKTENLVTVMWANEVFDAEYPDTFHEPVLLEKGNKMINPGKGNIS